MITYRVYLRLDLLCTGDLQLLESFSYLQVKVEISNRSTHHGNYKLLVYLVTVTILTLDLSVISGSCSYSSTVHTSVGGACHDPGQRGSPIGSRMSSPSLFIPSQDELPPTGLLSL